MAALLAIGWFVWLVIAVVVAIDFIGVMRLVQMFPEGRRWWVLPAALASLAHVALVTHIHPF